MDDEDMIYLWEKKNICNLHVWKVKKGESKSLSWVAISIYIPVRKKNFITWNSEGKHFKSLKSDSENRIYN